ncbi:MAG TPA: long-chain fatty acid--CoA ligase, partial [Spirochaetes bacterium]|nr:long-chain fatty acid--CoA ligase [Spirochaetota bacterium]
LQVSQKPPVVQKLFAWAQRVGADVSKCAEENKKPGAFLKLRHKLAYALVFKKLQEALGGRIRWICAAGAPISRDIVNFFNAAGIFILEGYGLSEVCGGATLSNLNDFSPGSVGRFLPGFEYRIAEDGEILIRGDMLFKGYYRMEEETREAFDEEGYFKTGDIGVIDERGLLYITDRKKDLLITAGGKNVAPQKIETLFKKNPLFAQVVVVGDRKKYLTALINLNLEIAEKNARENGIQFGAPAELADNHQFLRLVDKFIEDINSQLARYETIKKYTVLKNEFSQETGELTVSLKVKRNVVQEKYKNVIDTMYIE